MLNTKITSLQDQQRQWPLPLAVILTCSLATNPASAEFLGLSWEWDNFGLDGVTPLDQIAGYSGQQVINIYAQFDSAQDQCFGVVGTPETPLLLGLVDPDNFINQPLFGDDVPVSIALVAAFADLNWDSFFTIGTRFSNEQTTPLILDTGTPGPNTNPWAGNSTNSGWSIAPEVDGKPTPESVAGPHLRVLLMRIVSDADSYGFLANLGVMVIDPEPRVVYASGENLCFSPGVPPDCNFNGYVDYCDFILGQSEDCNDNDVPDECEAVTCECTADIARPGDGMVNVSDLTVLILSWGAAGGPADLNDDGIVNVADLVLLIGAWGKC